MDLTTVELESPLKRGEETITSVQLRKPTAGELRGVSLGELARSDVGSLFTVLPRITIPTLSQADLSRMDPVDFLQMGGVVVGFLLPKGMVE